MTGSASSGGRKKTGTKRKTSTLTSKAKSTRKSTTKKKPAAKRKATKKKATKKSSTKVRAQANDAAKSPRRNADEVVRGLPKSDLTELFRFWAGDTSADVPKTAQAIRDQVLTWIDDQEYVAARIAVPANRSRFSSLDAPAAIRL